MDQLRYRLPFQEAVVAFGPAHGAHDPGTGHGPRHSGGTCVASTYTDFARVFVLTFIEFGTEPRPGSDRTTAFCDTGDPVAPVEVDGRHLALPPDFAFYSTVHVTVQILETVSHLDTVVLGAQDFARDQFHVSDGCEPAGTEGVAHAYFDSMEAFGVP